MPRRPGREGYSTRMIRDALSKEKKMKLTSLFLAGVAMLHAAAPITQADLDNALTSAKSAWGISVDVDIRLKSWDGCKRIEVKRGDGRTAGDESQNEIWATTSDTTTTLIFASDDPDNPPEGGVPAPVTSHTRIILVNQDCKWTPEFLGYMIQHEYGHALGIMAHSANPQSIMYGWVFDPSAARRWGHQMITAPDLAAASQNQKARR